jgi:Kef-type K+ transport system membrane component KefB
MFCLKRQIGGKFSLVGVSFDFNSISCITYSNSLKYVVFCIFFSVIKRQFNPSLYRTTFSQKSDVSTKV